jgi:ankyrin repeat protein
MGCNPLQVASSKKHLTIVKLLFKHSPRLLNVVAHGKTALDWARDKKNNDSVIKLLLSYGAQTKDELDEESL